MTKNNIQGTIFNNTGYDIHTRQLANALHEEGAEVSLQVPLPPNWPQLVTDQELLMINRGFQKDGTTIAITQPPHWKFALAEQPKNTAGFAVWEGDCVPSFWIESLADERLDAFFVPSEHTKQAILNTIEIYNFPHSH